MVCCLCVDVNSAVILSWAFRREQRDIGGVPGSSLVGGPEEPSWMQRGMLCPLLLAMELSRPPALCTSPE